MKKSQIQTDSLEYFIKSLLPEGTVVSDSNYELMGVSKLIMAVLNRIDKNTNEESIFNAFYNLHYAMSVVEPVQQSKQLKPYIETNSHAIYIGINPDKLELLHEYLNISPDKGVGLPVGLHDIYRLISQLK